MKKIWAIIMAFMMFSGTTANAAWEFDEKVLREDSNPMWVLDTSIDDGVIVSSLYKSAGREEYWCDYLYYNLNGNEIDKPTKPDAKNEKEYFTGNKKSIVEHTDSGIILKNKEGEILASGFELSNSWEQNDVARKVKHNEKYGIMAYDGRMIIPMENEGSVIYEHGFYAAVNDGITSVYNFEGEHLFTLDKGVSIARVGSADWMSVYLTDSVTQKYALINHKGEYLTDFDYSYLKIYDNNEEWQSGSFASIGNYEYIDRNLNKINICSVDFVYCEKYEVVGNIAVIENSNATAVYNIAEGKYTVPFQYDDISTNGEMLTFVAGSYYKSYVTDLYGNRVDFQERIYDIKEFEDDIAWVRGINRTEFYVDRSGNNIFGKRYADVLRIDNNEFLVSDGEKLKILTAKGIIGEALCTDVKIDINGVAIPCRSVYGYAAVVAEDLRNFGFDVIWDEENRMLRITRNPGYYTITPMEYEADGVSGEHYADIYGSDINVEYNGKRLSSYCIDGRTLIKIEDLAAEGISFNYDNAMRTLYMSVDGFERE